MVNPGDSEKSIVQPLWRNQILPKLNTKYDADLTICLHDLHATPTIGTRKPGILSIVCFSHMADLPGYVKDKPLTIFYLAVVGEIKSVRITLDEFTDEEKGQMDSFLVDLLQYQPQRTEATGFLTDANIIQFFKIEKTGPLSYYLHESKTYNLADEGGPLLLGLLQTNPTKLGLDPFILFNNKEIVCQKGGERWHSQKARVFAAPAWRTREKAAVHSRWKRHFTTISRSCSAFAMYVAALFCASSFSTSFGA